MRVDLSLAIVRDEIKRQLDATSQLPQMFTFLRRVGDFLTLVSRMQEDMLKVKHFAPPYAPNPEIYILDVAECENFEGFLYPQKPAEVSSMLPVELPPLWRHSQPLGSHNSHGMPTALPGDLQSWQSRPNPYSQPRAYGPPEWEQSSAIRHSQAGQMQINYNQKSRLEEFPRPLHSDQSIPQRNYEHSLPSQQALGYNDMQQARRDQSMNHRSRQGTQLQENLRNTSIQDKHWPSQDYHHHMRSSIPARPMTPLNGGLYNDSIEHQNPFQSNFAPNAHHGSLQQSYNSNFPSDPNRAHENSMRAQNSTRNEQTFRNGLKQHSNAPSDRFPIPEVNHVSHNLQEMSGKGINAASPNSFQEGFQQYSNGNNYGGVAHPDRNYRQPAIPRDRIDQQLVPSNDSSSHSTSFQETMHSNRPSVTYDKLNGQQQQQEFNSQQNTFQQQQQFQFQQQPHHQQQQYSFSLQEQPKPPPGLQQHAVHHQGPPQALHHQGHPQSIQQQGQPQVLHQQGQPQASQQQGQPQALHLHIQPQSIQHQGQLLTLHQQGQPQAIQQQSQPLVLRQQGQPQTIQGLGQPQALHQQSQPQVLQQQGQPPPQSIQGLGQPQALHQQGQPQALQQQSQPQVLQQQGQPQSIQGLGQSQALQQQGQQPQALQQQPQQAMQQQSLLTQQVPLQQQVQPAPSISQQVQTQSFYQQAQPEAIQQQSLAHQHPQLHQLNQQQQQVQPNYQPNQMHQQQMHPQQLQQQDQQVGFQQVQPNYDTVGKQQTLSQELQHQTQDKMLPQVQQKQQLGDQQQPLQNDQQPIQHQLELKHAQKQSGSQSPVAEHQQNHEQMQEQLQLKEPSQHQLQQQSTQDKKDEFFSSQNNINASDSKISTLGGTNRITKKTSFDKILGDKSTHGTVVSQRALKNKSSVTSDKTENIKINQNSIQKAKGQSEDDLKQSSKDKQLEHSAMTSDSESKGKTIVENTLMEVQKLESSGLKEEKLLSILQNIKEECDNLGRQTSDLDLLLETIEETPPTQTAGEMWKKKYEEEKSRTLELQKSSFSLKRELKRLQESVEPRREAREAAKSRPTGRRSAPSDISSMKICIRKKQAVVNSKKADVNRFKLKLEQEKEVYSKVSEEVKQLRKKVSEHKMKLNKEATEKRRLRRAQHR